MNEFKLGISFDAFDVSKKTIIEVVDANYGMTFLQQFLCEVGTNESGNAGNKNLHSQILRSV